MPDAGYPPPSAEDVVLRKGVVTVRVEDIHVRYRIDEDVNRSLRAMVAAVGRPRHRRYVHAVKGVSFTARAGEVVGVIGSNGSGKTSMMRAVAGLLPVTEGAVYARSTPMLLGVGAVLNKQLSGRRNILLGGLALGLTADQVKAKEADIIDFSGIGHAIDRPMRTYSAGMSARLQFSISAAVKPEILIIDEALSVGDREFREKSQQRIRELREAAGTVFIVSHSMQSVRRNCTRVLWIEDGELVAEGHPNEVTTRYDGAPPERVRRRRQRRQRRRRRAQERAGAQQYREAVATSPAPDEGLDDPGDAVNRGNGRGPSPEAAPPPRTQRESRGRPPAPGR